MGKYYSTKLIVFLFMANSAADAKLILYQVGQDGKYCLSTTTGSDGCVSGANPDGNAKNVIDMMEKGEVSFVNLSDAPHDMKIKGKNAQDLPPQMPSDGEVVKQMNVPDLENRNIECSFHGKMLQVGYRVMPAVGEGMDDFDGHRPDAGAVEGPRDLVKTGLADVSDYILGKGPMSEVRRLLDLRPELTRRLQDLDPKRAYEFLFDQKQVGSLSNSPFKSGTGGVSNLGLQANGFGQVNGSGNSVGTGNRAIIEGGLQNSGKKPTADGVAGVPGSKVRGAAASKRDQFLSMLGMKGLISWQKEENGEARLAVNSGAGSRGGRGLASVGRDNSPVFAAYSDSSLTTMKKATRPGTSRGFSWPWFFIATSLSTLGLVIIGSTRRRGNKGNKGVA